MAVLLSMVVEPNLPAGTRHALLDLLIARQAEAAEGERERLADAARGQVAR